MPEKLFCLTCLPPYSVENSIKVGEPLALVLSDPNFPLVLPAVVDDAVLFLRSQMRIEDSAEVCIEMFLVLTCLIAIIFFKFSEMIHWNMPVSLK